jgi:hypothetical protein
MNKLIPNYLYYDYYLGDRYLEKLAGGGGRVGAVIDFLKGIGGRARSAFNSLKRWWHGGEPSPLPTTPQAPATVRPSATPSTSAGNQSVVLHQPQPGTTASPDSLLGHLRNAYLGSKGRIALNLGVGVLAAPHTYNSVYEEAARRYGKDSYVPHLLASLAAAGILISPAAFHVPKSFVGFHHIARPLAAAGAATYMPHLVQHLPFGLGEKILDLYEGSWLQRNTGFDILSPLDWATFAGTTTLLGRLIRFPPFSSQAATRAANFKPGEVYLLRNSPFEIAAIGGAGLEGYNLLIHPYADENLYNKLRRDGAPYRGDLHSYVGALAKNPLLKPERMADSIAEFLARRDAKERYGKELEELESYQADALREQYTQSTSLKEIFDKLSPEDKYEIILNHLKKTRGGGGENSPFARFVRDEAAALERAQIEKERRIQEQKQRLANTARQVFANNPKLFAGASPEIVAAMYGFGSDLQTSLQYNPDQTDLILSIYSRLSPPNYQTPRLNFNPYPIIKAPVNTLNSPIISRPQPPLLPNVSFDHFATASGPRGWAYSMQRQNFHPLVQHRINDQRARGAAESGLTT